MIRMCFACQSEELCSHREEGLQHWYRAQLPKPEKIVTFGTPRKPAALELTSAETPSGSGIAKPGATVRIARTGERRR